MIFKDKSDILSIRKKIPEIVMYRKFVEFIKKNELLNQNEKIVVGVSGALIQFASCCCCVNCRRRCLLI